MKRFPVVVFFLMVCISAYGETIFYAGNPYDIESFPDDEIIIENGAIINSSYGGVISINYPSVLIENYGVINANIDTNGRAIQIRNGGDINGTIIMDTGSAVMQIIKSAADINSLNVSDGHTLSVEINGFDGLADLAQLKALRNTGAFQITNSSIVMDDFSEWQNWDMDISLSGSNTLYINNPETVQSGVIIAHVVNPAGINVVLVNSENLYTVTVQPLGGGAQLSVVRETDYDKVFNNEELDVFNILRENHIDDKLLGAMDSADNIGELQSIMNSSYRFNRSVLMRPVRAIANLSLMNIFDYENSFGISFRPSYVYSKDYSGYGLRADFAGMYQDFYFDIGLFFDRFNYENDFNDFSGNIYGLDAKFKRFIDDNIWIDGGVGLLLTDFKADYIYVNNEFKNNPYGFALYGRIEGGYDYRFFDDFVFSPFLGAVFQNMQVLDFSDNDINLLGGGNIKYSFGMDGIRYEYSWGGAIATNGDIFAMLRVGFTSVSDGAGISIGLDAVKDDYAVNYRMSLTGKITF